MHYFLKTHSRWEHLQELYTYLGIVPYSSESNQKVIDFLTHLATQTDKGAVLAAEMVAWLRQHHIVVPSVSVTERACAEALTHGARQVYATLNDVLSPLHRIKLDALLDIPEQQQFNNYGLAASASR